MSNFRHVLLAHVAGMALLMMHHNAYAVDATATPKAEAKMSAFESDFSSEKAQEVFLEAESMNGYPAIYRWRELFQQDEAVLSVLPRGKDGVRTRLIQSLLNAIPAETNPQRQQDWLDEVDLLASLTSDPLQRSWVYVLLLKQLNPTDQVRVEKVVRLTQDSLEKIKDSYVRSYAASAFVEVLLTAPSSGALHSEVLIEKAKSTLSHEIVTAQHRARVVHLLALKQITDGAQYTQLLQQEDKESLAKQLFQLGRKEMADGKLDVAARLVLAAANDHEKERTELLKEIAKAQLGAGLLQDALATVWGIADEKQQNKQLKNIASDLLDDDEVPSAEIVAAQVDDGLTAVKLWTEISDAYREKGYVTRMRQVHEHAVAAASRITRPAKRAEAFAIVAQALSEQGNVDAVPQALKEAQSDDRYPSALSAYVVELSRQGKLELAKQAVAGLKSQPVSVVEKKLDEDAVKAIAASYEVAWAAIAKAYAVHGDVKAASDILLETIKEMDSAERDDALLSLVKAYGQQKKIDEASAAIDQIHLPTVKAIGYAELAALSFADKKQDVAQRYTGLVIRTIIKEANTKVRDDAFVVVGSRYLDVGMEEQARALFGAVTSDDTKAGLHTSVARYLASKGDVEKAEKEAEQIEKKELRDKAYAAVSDALVRANHVRDAVAIIRKMKGDSPRVQAFHSAARTQAYRTDFYGLMKGMEGNTQPPEQLASPGNTMPSPYAMDNTPLDSVKNKAFEEQIVADSRQSKDATLLTPPMPSVIGRQVPPFDAKALQVNENRATLAARVPANTDFLVSPISYEHSTFQQKFYTAMGASGFFARQQQFAPDMLVLERGVADISGLYLALRAQGVGDDYIKKEGRIYTLRRPLLISPNATLVISGADVNELRLSSDRGAYVVNAGNLYVQDTRVTGWDEAKQKEDHAELIDKFRFRPFITSWSRSHTYMGGSVFSSLGYADAKAYGISLTSGPKDLVQFKPDSIEAPDGVIAENSFRNIYYGFYSYEAERVALIGNEYKDNIIYGIDPHDRSRWLTIAFNSSWGAMKKHGIIISREVNDTTILGNLTFENHGSGLMIDRLSVGTMMYGNTSFDNLQDGITIFESDCKVIASNRLFSNKRTGLKVRNARDVGVFYNVIHDNKRAGVEGYIADLRKNSASATRDFELDPYSDINAMTVVGNWIERNGSGLSALDTAALFVRGNFFVQQSPRLWNGTWKNLLSDIVMRFDLQKQGVFITQRCPKGELLEHRKACRFRKDGYFTGDGQDRLEERIQKQLCGTGS